MTPVADVGNRGQEDIALQRVVGRRERAHRFRALVGVPPMRYLT